ncbi:IS30 family transposase [Rhodococcus sp. ACPA1]|uniref:IS30 family transposase n=1 Tax=Rhodococcus sp. ACPA1 TaxID=2028572 RepID=UPI000BB0DE70|nr:IS30 family transposase [Rhodococcus sp. ACPA1]PBC57078.1 IS30 family transposase [Rhodococcus sp. ACPA1]
MVFKGRPPIERRVREQFWECLRAGQDTVSAACEVQVSLTQMRRWLVQVGGVRPRRPVPPSGRYLSLSEREQIDEYRRDGWTIRAIAHALGRSPSTISRELRRALSYRGKYLASRAQRDAEARARRPKTAKLAAHAELREQVQGWLGEDLSPQQISHKLRREYPSRPEMWVSHESIYQALFVQSRGALTRELTAHLRTGRYLRKHRSTVGERRGKFPDMVMISERPAEVEDRAVPGHWEGDLIIGANNKSAIGTLVERSTRFVMLLHLPDGHSAEQVRSAMTRKITELPEHLAKSITWDQGAEMSQHARFTVETGVPVYFCDPRSPWQRGTNENTNGLLRQYFPKGIALDGFDEVYLDVVADKLNRRPRMTLDWDSPAERLGKLVVATAA